NALELIDDPVHLVSEIVRWAALHGNRKHRLRATSSVRQWIGETLRDAKIKVHARLGGVSAVDTLQGRALGDSPAMMALGPLPRGIRAHLPADTKVVGDDAAWSRISDLPSDESSADHFGIN